MNRFSMIFPGQGFQKFTNIINLSNTHSIIKNTFEEVSEYLKHNLLLLIKDIPVKKLYNSKFIESIIITTSVSIYRLWIELKGKAPFIVAGNSLGEYSALICSNVLTLKDTIKLIQFRSQLMKETVKNKKTAMQAIIGLDKKTVIDICKKQTYNKIVTVSNFNTLDQIVISGDQDAVKKASIACKLAGAQHTHMLPINVASHCSLMKSAEKSLFNKLKKINFKKPMYPILNNVDVKCESSKKKIVDALVRQISNPVRWQEIIEYMISKKIILILEAGSNAILTKMHKKNSTLKSIVLNNEKNFYKALSLT